ncbi:MAG: alpha/beta hydrolase-fold protein [Acidobacteriota bacterium]
MAQRLTLANACAQRASRLVLLILLALAVPGFAFSQEGRLVREKVHGVSLEKTVTGESADRRVSIYLPPSYDTSPEKRYPVIYLLHGITDTDGTWIFPWTKSGDPWQTIPGVMNRGIAEKRFGEMIVVMPDELTRWGGSFYTNSSVTGNWEDFTVKDLVNYVDGKYRTLARVSSRGIAGHSMGGYGAIKLGMKFPDLYSVVYGINPAVLGWGRDLTVENPSFKFLLTNPVTNREEAFKGGIYALGSIVVGQAFSPNPGKPPLFVDLPFMMVDGQLQPAEPAFSKWQENMPLYMVEKYEANLRKLRGLRFDSGYEDEFTHIPPTSKALSTALTARGIAHIFEEYNGDHRNRMWGRTGRMASEVLPYFWLLLDSRNEAPRADIRTGNDPRTHTK